MRCSHRQFSKMLQNWSNSWQMEFNSSKCYALRVSRKTGGSIHYNYNIDGALLASLANRPFLGVHFSNDLLWNVHVNKISSKANSTLAFLRRNLSMCSRKNKSNTYKILVRRQLEFSSDAWDPNTSQNIKKLEDVKCRAARLSIATMTSITLMLPK